MGFLLRKYQADLPLQKMLKYGLMFLIINCICFSCIYEYHATSIPLKVLMLALRMVTEISGALMAFMLLGYMASKFNTRSSFLSMMVNLSFPIYLLHQQVIYVLLWNLKDSLSPMLMTVVNFIIALFLSCCLGLLFKNFSFTSFLIGEKSKQIAG